MVPFSWLWLMYLPFIASLAIAGFLAFRGVFRNDEKMQLAGIFYGASFGLYGLPTAIFYGEWVTFILITIVSTLVGFGVSSFAAGLGPAKTSRPRY